MRTTIWLTALLAVAGTGAADPTATPASVGAVLAVGDFDAIAAEYDQAVIDWREKLKNAERGQRSAVRKAHPAKAFWPRFERIGDAGEGRALLWLIENMKDAGVGLKERGAKSVPYFDKLVDQHREAEWFGSVLEQIAKNAARLEPQRVATYYEVCATKTERAETKGQAMYQWAKMLSASENEADVARADALFERLATEFTGSEWARMAQVELAGKNLQPGKKAPNFEAKTIDGHEFQLSDYEGKVVLVDFYGFW